MLGSLSRSNTVGIWTNGIRVAESFLVESESKSGTVTRTLGKLHTALTVATCKFFFRVSNPKVSLVTAALLHQGSGMVHRLMWYNLYHQVLSYKCYSALAQVNRRSPVHFDNHTQTIQKQLIKIKSQLNLNKLLTYCSWFRFISIHQLKRTTLYVQIVHCLAIDRDAGVRAVIEWRAVCTAKISHFLVTFRSLPSHHSGQLKIGRY